MAPIPQTMSGILIEETGGIEVLKWKTDLPVPGLKEGEVLVRNEFIGVNYIDTYFRTGLYPSPLPLITGKEAAGTIVALHPSVTATAATAPLQPGTRVAYIADHTYASYTAVPATHLAVIPDSVSTQDACACLLQGLTALTFAREIVVPPHGRTAAATGTSEGTGTGTGTGSQRPYHYALVHAAAGGTGGMLVQMLRAVHPDVVRVIGTAGGAGKCAVARENGCEWVVDSSGPGGAEEVVRQVQEITGGRGADVIFDGVGKATFEGDLQMIARKGTLAMFGNASGPAGPVDLFKLSAKNIKLMRPALFGYIATPEERAAYTKELFDLLEAGKVKVKTHKIYALKDAAQAHSDLEGKRTTGKLLLQV
ncbi:hypothetical protein VTK26DRAFT_1363 [Humicola hyalothermophila]